MTAPYKFDFRPSALWEVEKAELLEKLHKTVEALEKGKGSWEPFGFEQNFGIKEAPPFKLDIDGDIVPDPRANRPPGQKPGRLTVCD